MQEGLMRVGFVGNIPPPIGGAEVFLQRFFEQGVKRGTVESVLVRWRKQIFRYFPETLTRTYATKGAVRQILGIPVHYLFEATPQLRGERDSAYGARMVEHYTPQAFFATEIFARARVKLIHAHMLFPNLFFAAKAARTLSLPLVVTIHGMLEFRLFDYYRKRYGQFAKMAEECLAQAQRVVGISDEIVSESLRRGARKVVKIPGGIDTKWFQVRSGEFNEGKDVVFLGSVREEKGAPLLIQAFERMNGSANTNLVFVGKLLLQGRLAKRARANPRIRFLGERSAQGVRAALKRAKMVVLPSASEGLPMSVLQAMAMEKPVLVTKTGGLTKLIKDGQNGFFIRKRNPSVLASQIKELLARSDLQAVGKAARQTAVSFDIRKVVRQYEELYRSLCR